MAVKGLKERRTQMAHDCNETASRQRWPRISHLNDCNRLYWHFHVYEYLEVSCLKYAGQQTGSGFCYGARNKKAAEAK